MVKSPPEKQSGKHSPATATDLMTRITYQTQQTRGVLGTTINVSVVGSRTHLNTTTHTHHWRPPTDVTDADNVIIVTVAISGMGDGEFHITLQERQLAISGTRARTSGMYAYHQMEIPYGEFSTETTLPAPVQTNRVKANYTDGFLTITLPKQTQHILTTKLD